MRIQNLRHAIWVLFLGMPWMVSCANPCYAQGVALGTFYSPVVDLEALDVSAIYTAKTSIDMAAFSLTDPAIVTALSSRAVNGVHIRIYLDRGELESECRGDVTCARVSLHELLGMKNTEIRVKHSKVLMHLKAYEIDGYLVRDGSANFSPEGENRQDNSAVFAASTQKAKEFVDKFNAMWSRPDNLTVVQAVAEPQKE